jgi:hypothetical protein
MENSGRARRGRVETEANVEDKEQTGERTWTEEFEFQASELVDRVKELIQQGNVRRIIIRRPNDELLLEIPLTTGAVVGSILAFFTPILAAVGAMAALLASVKVQIVRVEDPKE